MQKEAPREQSRASQVAGYVGWQIRRLTESGNEAAARAALARLRRGIGKPPGSLPELWGETLGGMPEALVGKGGQPSWGEWASYIAITLFALHQQGKDWKTDSVNREGETLGRAVRRLIASPDDEIRVKRRFDQVITSDGPEEAANHLRGLVQLLKAADVPLDYPALAADLYRYQIDNERDGVRLRWGRDYYTGQAAGNLVEVTEDQTENDQMEGEDHDE